MVGKMTTHARLDPFVEAQVFSPKLQKAFCEGASGTFDPSIINNRDPALEGAAIRGILSGTQGGAPPCAGGTTPGQINDSVPPQTVFGPYPMSDGGQFWIDTHAQHVLFNTDNDPEADVSATYQSVTDDVHLSDESKLAIHTKLLELTGSGLPGFTPPPLGG